MKKNEIILGKQRSYNGKPLKELKKFKCKWCNKEFAQYVRKLDLDKTAISTQVKCPQCNNFIKTW